MDQASAKFTGWTVGQRCDYVQQQLARLNSPQDLARLLVDVAAGLLANNSPVDLVLLQRSGSPSANYYDQAFGVSDYQVLWELFAPTELLVQAVLRYMKESPQLRVEMLYSELPEFLQRRLMYGSTCELLKDRFNGMARSLYLTPLEYLLLNFALHMYYRSRRLITKDLAREPLYTSLAEAYMRFFLPVNFQSPGNRSMVDSGYSGSKHRLGFRPAFRTPLNLFKKELYLKAGADHSYESRTSQSEAGMCAQALVQIFTDIWMDCDFSGQNTGLSGSLVQPTLPHPERVRVIRNLIKNVHYFAFYPEQAAPGLQEVRNGILPRFVHKVLYQFLKFNFQKWQLDGSFRFVLELWLSYLQPWRYALGLKDEQSLKDRWDGFFYANYLFFATPFTMVLDRLGRMDLRTTRNAFLLYRVTKLMSLDRFEQVIKDIDAVLSTAAPQNGMMPRLSGNDNRARLLAHVSALESSNPDLFYASLTSLDVKMKVERLQNSVKQAVVYLSGAAEQRERSRLEQEAKMSYFQRFLVFLGFYRDESVNETSENLKIVSELSASSDILKEWFGIGMPERNVSWDSLGPHDDDLGEIYFGYGEPETMYDEGKQRLSLSPRGRYQVVNGMCRATKFYNPKDAALGRFDWPDSMLNESISPDTLSTWYHSKGAVGKVVRWFVLPSTQEERRERLSALLGGSDRPFRLHVQPMIKNHPIPFVLLVLFLWYNGYLTIALLLSIVLLWYGILEFVFT